MATKICFKCNQEKDLDDFYKHPQMGDGHLNKCKECNKTDVRENYEIKAQDPFWVEKERKRGRDKYHRLNYVNSLWNERKKTLFWCTNEYKGLRKWVCKKIKLTEMDEIHHWNYNRIKDFFVLDRSFHAKIHQLMVINEETGIFTTKDGVLLDTKAKHMNFLLNIIEKKNISKCNMGVYDFTTNF